MRRATFLFLLTSAATAAFGADLSGRIEQILQVPIAQRAVWGIHAIDLATGRLLYARNAGLPLTPASNTKLFTTALALKQLGPDYRLETQVFASRAPDALGVLRGDLRLVGGGEPLKDMTDLADAVVRAGVRVIEGDVIGDDTRWPWVPYPEGWSVDDLVWDYGAAVSALTCNDNAQTLTVRLGKTPHITLAPPVEYFTLFNTLRIAEGAPRKITLDRMPGSRVLMIGGTAPPKGPAATLSIGVDDPALFAAQAFVQLLRARGLLIKGAVRSAHRPAGQPYLDPPGTFLARRRSEPLSEILRTLNKMSNNLYAEMVLREIGVSARSDGTVEAAQKAMSEFLTGLGVPKEEFSFEDGSGLSRGTLASPSCVTTLLKSVHEGDHRDLFFDLLPIAGVDGTLQSRFRGVAGASAIRAKTGSISHVAALSGYGGLDPARRVAFSILVNGYTAPSSEIRGLIDRIALAILEEGQR